MTAQAVLAICGSNLTGDVPFSCALALGDRVVTARSAPGVRWGVGGAITTRSRGRWAGNVLRSAARRVKPRTIVVPATARSAASSSSVALAANSSKVNAS